MSGKGKVTTVGMFDGVHRGHVIILDRLRQEADALGAAAQVITFLRHPLSLIDKQTEPIRLTTNAERRQRLYAAGIDEVCETEFATLRHLTAAEFLHTLAKQGTQALVMGFNNHIGTDRCTAAQIAALGIMPVYEVSSHPETAHISSSAVRAALQSGDIPAANDMLGRSYCVSGIVVHGRHIGHSLGFPTANIIGYETLLPADGVYAVYIHIPGSVDTLSGMANIGTRPTFGNDGNRTFEVHIFDFNGDIYDRAIRVDFVARLRGERRFGNSDELRAALARDRRAATDILHQQ